MQALAPSAGALSIEASGADATIGVLTVLALINVLLIGLLWAVCRPRLATRRVTMLTLRTLYFEDLSVGMTERLAKTVASSDVVGFAEVTGDRNPIHLSEHFAAKTPFGTRIAHGLYTASLISAVLGTRLPGPGAVYISQTLNFRAPVKIGDTVEVSVAVAELLPEKFRARLACTCTVDGETVLDGEAWVKVPSRKHAGGARCRACKKSCAISGTDPARGFNWAWNLRRLRETSVRRTRHAHSTACQSGKIEPAAERWTIDWIGIWALILGAIAVSLAMFIYIADREPMAASFVFIAFAAIIGVVLRKSAQRHDERLIKNRSATRRRREEAARRPVRPLAAPIGAVGRGQRLAIGHDLVDVFLVRRTVGCVAGHAYAICDRAAQRIAAEPALTARGATTPQSSAPQHHSPAGLR